MTEDEAFKLPKVPFGVCIARRQYRWRPPVGRARIVKVSLGTPVRVRGGNWACPLRISGLPEAIDRPVFGIDSVQALELALHAASRLISNSPQFLAGQLEQYDKAVITPLALGLPLQLSGLQNALVIAQLGLENVRPRGWVQDEMLRGTLAMFREIRQHLAVLEAHLPIAPRQTKPRR